jgi:thiamine biosynthesis protein ThiS
LSSIIYNGKKIELEKEVQLSEFLRGHGYDLQKVAVERNGNVVPKKEFDIQLILNNDIIEVVHFVGGG